MTHDFVHRCLNDTIEGLRTGLSKFSGPSNVAVIFSLRDNDKVFVYDPDCLLRGHEPKLEKFYHSGDPASYCPAYKGNSSCYSHIDAIPPLDLDGLLCFGGSSATVPYQRWFTNHHPDMISTGPTLRWLEHAVLRFSHDIANQEDLYTGISGSFLKEYANHAIHSHLQKEMEIHTGEKYQLPIYPILEAILGISKTREEGAWPFGQLGFIDPRQKDGHTFLARFVKEEQPRLDHYKHVRKLLQTVEESHHALLCDGSNILGICDINFPQCSLTANFQGRYGYLLLNGEAVCSFADGEYKSSSLRAKLFEIEETLLDYNLEPATRNNLFYIISYLVHRAQVLRHGCTFVLDLNEKPTKISGQLLDNPLDLSKPHLLNLATSLSKVDGALHIHKDEHLHGFACLLDGQAIEGEDRARGARYNSALRFTAQTPNTITVVVSSDRPVSVISSGIVYHGHCKWKSRMTNCSLRPEPLEKWLNTGD